MVWLCCKIKKKKKNERKKQEYCYDSLFTNVLSEPKSEYLTNPLWEI